MFPLFATDVVDTDSKLSLVSLKPVANLRPVSMILVANLPPVSLITVVHHDLQISLRIFDKFEMTLMVFSEVWRKMIQEQNKFRDTVPLNQLIII